MSRYVWNDTLKYTAGEKFASFARRGKRRRRRRRLGEKVERKKNKNEIQKNKQTSEQKDIKGAPFHTY